MSSEPMANEIFGKQDPRPKTNMHEDTIYRLPLKQKKILEQQIEDFINTYKKIETNEQNLDLLIEKLFPSTRGIAPTHDHLIYLLATYLRFAICEKYLAKIRIAQ